MPRCIAYLLLLALVVIGAPAAAQRRVSGALEAQVGYAIPRGEFGTGETGARPRAGPRFALGGQIRLSGALALFVNYHQTWFGCANCALLELDDSMITRGAEAGIDLRPLPARFGARPWFRGAAVYQTLGFSDAEERLTSRAALGFSIGAGVAVPFHGLLELMPGIRFVVAPAEFDFATAPARSFDVRALTLEFGAAVRVGGEPQ